MPLKLIWETDGLGGLIRESPSFIFRLALFLSALSPYIMFMPLWYLTFIVSFFYYLLAFFTISCKSKLLGQTLRYNTLGGQVRKIKNLDMLIFHFMYFEFFFSARALAAAFMC